MVKHDELLIIPISVGLCLLNLTVSGHSHQILEGCFDLLWSLNSP